MICVPEIHTDFRGLLKWALVGGAAVLFGIIIVALLSVHIRRKRYCTHTLTRHS